MQPCSPVQRTNDLVKAIFEVVELRGLEPLTFSLRRLRPARRVVQSAWIPVHAMHQHHDHGDVGAHMGHTSASFDQLRLPSGRLPTVVERFRASIFSVTE